MRILRKKHDLDGFFHDNFNDYEEGTFEHRGRSYELFRVTCEDKEKLEELRQRFGLPPAALDGDVLFVNSGRRDELARLGSTPVDDKTITCMIFNTWCGDPMGDEKTCWKIARERHRRFESMREQRHDEAKANVNEVKRRRDERRAEILDKAVESHERRVADERRERGEGHRPRRIYPASDDREDDRPPDPTLNE